MTEHSTQNTRVFTRNAVEAAIRIGVLALLLTWCFKIIQPFIVPLIWGTIIAVALFPLYRRLQDLLGGRGKPAALVFTLVLLALLIVPTAMLSGSLIESAQLWSARLETEGLSIAPPPLAVRDWPLIGAPVFEFWSLASSNPQEALGNAAGPLKAAGTWVLSTAAGAGFGLLLFVISIIIAGVLLAHARGAERGAQALAGRLAGEAGLEFTAIAGATIRSVAQGVVGVALIQALLAGLGLLAADVPGAGLWALLVLLVAVIQLPPLLILGPIIVYVFYASDTWIAVTFMIWALLVSASDVILKPLLLGRGLDIPMPVILVGAIGGMLLSGVIGLFIGPVVLAVGFRLFMVWLENAHAT